MVSTLHLGGGSLGRRPSAAHLSGLFLPSFPSSIDGKKKINRILMRQLIQRPCAVDALHDDRRNCTCKCQGREFSFRWSVVFDVSGAGGTNRPLHQRLSGFPPLPLPPNCPPNCPPKRPLVASGRGRIVAQILQVARCGPISGHQGMSRPPLHGPAPGDQPRRQQPSSRYLQGPLASALAPAALGTAPVWTPWPAPVLSTGGHGNQRYPPHVNNQTSWGARPDHTSPLLPQQPNLAHLLEYSSKEPTGSPSYIVVPVQRRHLCRLQPSSSFPLLLFPLHIHHDSLLLQPLLVASLLLILAAAEISLVRLHSSVVERLPVHCPVSVRLRLLWSPAFVFAVAALVCLRLLRSVSPNCLRPSLLVSSS